MTCDCKAKRLIRFLINFFFAHLALTPDVLVSCTNGLSEENLHHKCYVSLKEETFKLLMTTAHAHGSLEGI